jgi:hypothetical protein
MSIFCATPWNYVPRQVDDDCLQELRWLYARRDLAEARSDLAAWLARWAGKYPRKVRNRKPSAAAHFSVRSVAAHTGFSKSTVAPYFAQPHHSKGFSSSPTALCFVQKVRDIVGAALVTDLSFGASRRLNPDSRWAPFVNSAMEHNP